MATDQELDIWNFIHGTGAGCASIAAWEAAHLYLEGAAALVVFTGLTGGIMHAVHRHRKYLTRQIPRRRGGS